MWIEVRMHPEQNEALCMHTLKPNPANKALLGEVKSYGEDLTPN